MASGCFTRTRRTSLPVLDNFMIGGPGGFHCRKASHPQMLEESARVFRFHLNPDAPVRSLTVGERQHLEILRLLALGVEVLILDEPTTGISTPQKTVLFEALRKLAEQQKTILLVSHKLEDVQNLCDRVTVMRHGVVVGEADQPFDTGQILKWMFGTAPSPPSPLQRRADPDGSAHGGSVCAGWTHRVARLHCGHWKGGGRSFGRARRKRPGCVSAGGRRP